MTKLMDVQITTASRLKFKLLPLDTYVTLEHKTLSLKSLGYICSKSQKYIVSVKIIDFFMPKIIRILNKDHVPWRYSVHFLL